MPPPTTLTLARLAIDGMRVRHSSVHVQVASIELNDVELTAEGASLQVVRARQVRLKGVEATLATGAKALPPLANTAWHLEPLATLQGRLQAYITDAHWSVDADVTVPIDEGRIEFGRVTVEHIGPDSSMGASHLGIHVDAPNGRNYLYRFSASHVPGVRFEQRGGGVPGTGVADRGALTLKPFVEALLSGAALGDAPHPVEAQLDRTRLSGTLQLGDGALGFDGCRMVLEGSAQGRNRLAVSAAVVGQHVMAHWPELWAREAAFELDGRKGRCGAVRGAATLGLRRRSLILQADELTASDVQFGGADR
jgi:hypothetical protein